MTPREAGAALIRRLSAEIATDRQALAARGVELGDFLSDEATAPATRAAALALVLDRSYMGLEALMERVVRALDGETPSGPNWHPRLLELACLDVPRVRPAVLRRAAQAADELRRFRHFVRHGYAAPLDPDRVRELAESWRESDEALDQDLDDLQSFLDELSASAERGPEPPRGM